MEQQLILVVDDERMWRDILGRVFSGAGYRVLTAGSCAAAIAALRAARPDCVVLDFNLSDGNSLPVRDEIRALWGWSLPVVIFSSDPAAQACAETGGSGSFLLKLAPMEELLAMVKGLLPVPR